MSNFLFKFVKRTNCKYWIESRGCVHYICAGPSTNVLLQLMFVIKFTYSVRNLTNLTAMATLQ
jgi:hypothetical protein